MEIVVVILMLVLVAPLVLALWIVIRLNRLDGRTGSLSRIVREELAVELRELSGRVDALEARAPAPEEARPRREGTEEVLEPASEPAVGRADGDVEPARSPDAGVPELTGAGDDAPQAHVPRPEPAGRETADAGDVGGAGDSGGVGDTGRTPWKGLSGVDLEEIIGGAWLNRVGVLITVIGMALGLGYSFQYLGPVGRVGTSLMLALAMLGGGIVLERRDTYRNYGRGLIGGGWAALYVTTYAAHAVEAARVVDEPALAAALLMAVALGMILHSLRYRSQAVTGTAFLVAFATLAVTDLSTFAVVASIPLAAALLFVAHRFGWGGLAALGVVATYGTYLLSEGTLPRTGSAAGDFFAGQAALLGYWLLFEGFDLSRLRGWLEAAAGADDRAVAAVGPLNAAGFAGISLLQWSDRAPEMVGWFATLATALYVASAILRARIRPPATDADPEADVDAWELATSGGYPVPVVVAALMGALALSERYSGLGLTLAWALEAQFLFLAGLYLRQPFLRGLAAAAFVLPWAQLLGNDVASGARIEAFGLELREWTPLAVLMAAVAYVDRFLLVRRDPMMAEHLYSWVASWTLLIVVGTELPDSAMELGWLVMAAVLFEAGRATNLLEFRGQGYAVASLAFLSLLALKIVGIEPGPTRPWVSLAPATAFGYAAAFRLGRIAGPLGERERALARNLSAVAGGIMAVGLLGHALPDTLVTAGWAVLGTVLLVAGFPLRERMLRLSGLALLAVCIVKVFLWDLSELAPPFRVLSFLVLGLLLLGGSLVYTRSRERLRRLLEQ